jgi:hypothetical protein
MAIAVNTRWLRPESRVRIAYGIRRVARLGDDFAVDVERGVGGQHRMRHQRPALAAGRRRRRALALCDANHIAVGVFRRAGSPH